MANGKISDGRPPSPTWKQKAGGKFAASFVIRSVTFISYSSSFFWVGAPLSPSRNNPHNWGLVFTKAAQSTIPNASSDPPVGGVLSAISNVSIKNTGGLLDINTPQGQVDLGVHGPADTALPFDDLLSSPVALTYKVHSGTGIFQGVKGSGTVDVTLTPTGQSTEGTVAGGALTPSDTEGTLTFTFNPGT